VELSAIDLVCSAEILEASRIAPEKTAIMLADPGCYWLFGITRPLLETTIHSRR
jgi:hypothetical protein